MKLYSYVYVTHWTLDARDTLMLLLCLCVRNMLITVLNSAITEMNGRDRLIQSILWLHVTQWISVGQKPFIDSFCQSAVLYEHQVCDKWLPHFVDEMKKSISSYYLSTHTKIDGAVVFINSLHIKAMWWHWTSVHNRIKINRCVLL